MNPPTVTPPRLLADGLRFPEGPAFAPDGSLWCVELQGAGLVRWCAGAMTRYATGGAPNGAAVDAQGRIWFCDAQHHAIRRLDARSGEIETLASEVDGHPLNKPNDLAFDRAGNLVFTCPGDSRQEPTGYVCCLLKDGTVRKIATGLYFPNGLAFTADGAGLVIAETYRQRLWRGTWNDATCEWCEPTVWAEGLHGAPGPDGMAFAADGSLWVAVYGSGGLVRVNAAGGVIDHHPAGGLNPTNCAFDPAGLLGLVVTEAEHGNLWSHSGIGPGILLF